MFSMRNTFIHTTPVRNVSYVRRKTSETSDLANSARRNESKVKCRARILSRKDGRHYGWVFVFSFSPLSWLTLVLWLVFLFLFSFFFFWVKGGSGEDYSYQIVFFFFLCLSQGTYGLAKM